MRLLIIAAAFALFANNFVIAQKVFDYGLVFPGPNPDASDILPEADPETVFRIGQILFENSADDFPETENPERQLSDLPSVSDIVKLAGSHPSVDALVQQQLSIPHNFKFEQATVTDLGDPGFRWQVSHVLYPKQGGGTGVPFRYVTVLDAHGKIIPPRITVFDAYFHSRTDGWSVSTLRLRRALPAIETSLTEAVIRDRAMKQLETFVVGKGNDRAKRMQYRNQELVRIPVSTDSTGAIIYNDIWAINFADLANKDRPQEVFTVWVGADGSVAELRHFDGEIRADQQKVAPERR